MERYRDRNGLAYDDYRLWLPPNVALWPTPPRVKEDTQGLQSAFHEKWAGSECWWCKAKPRTGHHELHHLAGGMKGRSHETYLFTWLCKTCHALRANPQDLGRILYLKWYYDREETDWCRTAIRHGRWLPDLVF